MNPPNPPFRGSIWRIIRSIWRIEVDRFFVLQGQSWEVSSASDKKIHSIFEILPSTIGQYKARLFRDNTYLTDTQHLYFYFSQGKMSVSDTALSAELNYLQVKSASAFNTPMSGTPIPTTTMSSETVQLLNEAANRLKDPVSNKGKGVKREFSLQRSHQTTEGTTQQQPNPYT